MIAMGKVATEEGAAPDRIFQKLSVPALMGVIRSALLLMCRQNKMSGMIDSSLFVLQGIYHHFLVFTNENTSKKLP